MSPTQGQVKVYAAFRPVGPNAGLICRSGWQGRMNVLVVFQAGKAERTAYASFNQYGRMSGLFDFQIGLFDEIGELGDFVVDPLGERFGRTGVRLDTLAQ